MTTTKWCDCGCNARTPCSCATECTAPSHRNDETLLNDALWTEAPLAEPDPRVDYDSIHFRRMEGRLTDG